MFNIRSILLLGITGVLLTSGCASFRVITDLKPEADATLQSPAGRFYIAGFKYTFEPNEYKDRPPEEKLMRLVRQECFTRYPGLFGKNNNEGIPLRIEVSDSRTNEGGIWFFCTLGLAGLIFPCPATTDHDFVVVATPCNGRDTRARETMQMGFHRKEHYWGSALTPLALIPVPGESDMPKGSSVFNNGRDAYDSLPQIAQQVATAIAKLIATKEPEFWTTQPRLNNTSIGLPVRTGDAPVAPPVPTDSPTPF